MIPQQGQHVKCFMRSTMVLEGIVEEWTDIQVVLKSLDEKSLMIVHRPADDILLTKIFVLEETREISEEIIKKETPKEWLEAKHDIRDKLQEVISPTGDVDLDKLNINQLRELVHEQDKQLIVQKKREHFGTVGNVKRAMPYSDSLKIISNASHKLSGR
jgi:hypothetical protein